MLKIKFLRQYRKAVTGILVFVYCVTGAPEALAEYKKSKGENFIQDEKDGVLFFTTRPCGQTGTLIKSAKGEFIADTSALDMLHATEQQYGWNIAQKICGTKIATAEVEETEADQPAPAGKKK